MGWMSREDRQVLERIVALLFAFAALAELAGSKPCTLRAAVLRLLGAAEAIGRDFVTPLAAECGDRIVRPVPPWSPEEAGEGNRLAHSFRTLAGLLGEVLRRGLAPLSRDRLSRRIPDRMPELKSLVADCPALSSSALEPPLLDTS